MPKADIVLILGSGPNALRAKDFPRAPFDAIVAINNAWQVRADWNYLIHPEDFDPARMPREVMPSQHVITALDYVPAQNSYGGFVYAGGTMAFTAAYWALHALRPKVMAFFGCDMIYPGKGPTHFYGTGEADPLRQDVTLQDLTAKSARLAMFAARDDCHCINLSKEVSRLVFPRTTPDDLMAVSGEPVPLDFTAARAAEAREAELAYMVSSGRYWDQQDSFDASALSGLDSLWLSAYRAA
ncbi:MAG: hypothetical protein ABJI96_01315 [Paracoccaceae bacterium]